MFVLFYFAIIVQLFQIRLTSPEHQVRAHAYEDELGGGGGLHDRNGKDSPERGFGNGGGFFSKRFGITKMKVKIISLQIPNQSKIIYIDLSDDR